MVAANLHSFSLKVAAICTPSRSRLQQSALLLYWRLQQSALRELAIITKVSSAHHKTYRVPIIWLWALKRHHCDKKGVRNGYELPVPLLQSSTLPNLDYDVKRFVRNRFLERLPHPSPLMGAGGLLIRYNIKKPFFLVFLYLGDFFCYTHRIVMKNKTKVRSFIWTLCRYKQKK